MTSTKRGRPLKFGRPSQVLALTLPADVVKWLKGIHSDPAWAIEALHQRSAGTRQKAQEPAPKVELAELQGKRHLIVVDPRAYRDLRDVAVIPMAPGRAFLALEAGKTIADLELSLRDQMEDPRTSPEELPELRVLLDEIRMIRRSRRYRVSTRSILLVEKRPPRRPK